MHIVMKSHIYGNGYRGEINLKKIKWRGETGDMTKFSHK